MKNKPSGLLPPVGLSSLLAIFAILSLTVFALLAISTVQADERLQQKAQQAVTDYYAADCAAEALLARLRAGERPASVTEKDGIFSYTCPISATQQLVVEVWVDGTAYRILRWQAVSTAQWATEDALPVWEGTEGVGAS